MIPGKESLFLPTSVPPPSPQHPHKVSPFGESFLRSRIPLQLRPTGPETVSYSTLTSYETPLQSGRDDSVLTLLRGSCFRFCRIAAQLVGCQKARLCLHRHDNRDERFSCTPKKRSAYVTNVSPDWASGRFPMVRFPHHQHRFLLLGNPTNGPLLEFGPHLRDPFWHGLKLEMCCAFTVGSEEPGEKMPQDSFLSVPFYMLPHIFPSYFEVMAARWASG